MIGRVLSTPESTRFGILGLVSVHESVVKKLTKCYDGLQEILGISSDLGQCVNEMASTINNAYIPRSNHHLFS